MLSDSLKESILTDDTFQVSVCATSLSLLSDTVSQTLRRAPGPSSRYLARRGEPQDGVYECASAIAMMLVLKPLLTSVFALRAVFPNIQNLHAIVGEKQQLETPTFNCKCCPRSGG